MMGTKARIFAPIAVVSHEELVPLNHFYRHLDRVLDLSFVRELVKETYAHGGRPSIDPVVFFKLQLVMFFEDIRSERLLMQLVADKLSVRWFVGYNLDEPLPDHSSLTRIRERYGVEVFRRFFEVIVEHCQAAGLVWGKELYFDGTKVQANASVDSLKLRFFVEAHLADLFGTETEERPEETDQQPHHTDAVASPSGQQKETPLPTQLPVSLSQEEYQELAQHNAERHDWIEQLGAQERSVTHRCYQRMADLRVSTTDPDATLMLTKGGADMGYHTHYVVGGGKARIILDVLVTPSEVMDNQCWICCGGCAFAGSCGPGSQGSKILASLAHQVMKPAGAGANHVRRYLTNRAKVGCRSQGQLPRGKRSKRFDQKGLVVIPTGVEG